MQLTTSPPFNNKSNFSLPVPNEGRQPALHVRRLWLKVESSTSSRGVPHHAPCRFSRLGQCEIALDLTVTQRSKQISRLVLFFSSASSLLPSAAVTYKIDGAHRLRSELRAGKMSGPDPGTPEDSVRPQVSEAGHATQQQKVDDATPRASGAEAVPAAASTPSAKPLGVVFSDLARRLGKNRADKKAARNVKTATQPPGVSFHGAQTELKLAQLNR
jgi:hypothetical protein